ncbi:MAG TPA: hypothetical protein VH083_15020, partial [Myxococcales bacterium]|nr:hypothetical protein [Myxococcales bacterium]
QFSAAVANAPDATAVAWFVQDLDAGSISESGLYTAPGGSGTRTVHIAAESVDDPSHFTIAEITIDLRPAISSFSATPEVALPGATTKLSWTADGAETFSIDSGVGDVTGTNSVEVHPAVTTTYTLRAANAVAGVTRTVTVRVAAGVPAIEAFAASPGRILPGEKRTLSWSVSGADTVDLEPGIGTVAAAGSSDVSPEADTQYTLTATNAQGQSTASATVQTARFRVTSPLSVPRQTSWSDLDEDLAPWPSQNQNIVLLPDGTSLLIGGMFWQFEPTGEELIGPLQVGSAEIFDPAANTGEGGFIAVVPFPGDPSSIAPFQDDKDSFAVVQLPSGQVLTAAQEFYLYDPAARSFQDLGGNFAGRNTSAVVLPDGRVALLGQSSPLIYDPATGKQSLVTGPGCQFANAGVPMLLPSGKILVPGGLGCASELWEPSTPAGTLALTRSQAFFFPGFAPQTNNFALPTGQLLIDSFTLYDPATDSIVKDIRPQGFFTEGEPSVLLPNGWVLILGNNTSGVTGSGPQSFLYDPFTDTMHQGPAPLFSHAGGFAGVLADGTVLVAGGTDLDFEILSTTAHAEILEWQ